MVKLFLLLFVSFMSAQNYRFVYEYKMMTDLTKRDSLTTDYMNLDSDGKKSYFYNADKYESDSAYNVSKKIESLLNGKKYNHNLIYVIEKDYNSQEVNFYTKFVSVNVVIPEPEKLEWKLENDYMEINHMKCQKATANYKGRVWEAWFTSYPINDGPYKFNGLPGLIVKLNDSNREHNFDLIEIKKVSTLFNLLSKNNKKMSQEEYDGIVKKHVVNVANDAESFIANIQAGKVNVQMKDGYMAQFDYKDLKKNSKTGELNDEIAKRLRKTNNPIEKSNSK